MSILPKILGRHLKSDVGVIVETAMLIPIGFI